MLTVYMHVLGQEVYVYVFVHLAVLWYSKAWPERGAYFMKHDANPEKYNYRASGCRQHEKILMLIVAALYRIE